MMNFGADSGVFLNNNDFAVEVILPSKSIISGIFDNGTQTFGTEFEISSPEPTVLCISGEVEDIKNRDKLVVDNINYIVRDTEPDGTGYTKVILKR